MNYKIVFIFILSFSLNSIAQDSSTIKIDSLQQILKNKFVADTVKIDSYLELTKIYLHKNLDSAIFYVEKGKLLAKKNNELPKVARSLIEIARINEIQNNIEGSLANLDEAAKLYEDLNVDDTYITVCNFQGMYYEMLSNYDLSIEKYLLGLKMSIALNNRMYEAVFLDNLSQVYAKTNQFEKSLASILEAIAIYKVIGNKNQYFQAQIYVGNSYIKLGKYDLAREHLNKAKAFFTKINDHILLADIYAALGKISAIAENQDEALELFLIAQSHALKMKDYNGEQNYKLALINNNLGNIYLHNKNYSQAIQMFRSSEMICKEIKSIEILKDTYKGLAYSYLQLKKINSASHYLDLFIPINDSLLAEQYNIRIDALNYEFQLEIEKSVFEKDKELINIQKNSQKSFFISVLSILSLIILVVIFFFYALKTKYKKSNLLSENLELQKEKLTLDLEIKNKELSATLLNLIERNKFISTISENLDNIKTKEDKTDLVKIKRMISKIDKDLTKNLWKEFENTYVEVHKGFFDKLSNISIALTSNERRLCALIKLNMSTKEISSITYQSEHSIKVARYRLRKKLCLVKNENLASFLNNL